MAAYINGVEIRSSLNRLQSAGAKGNLFAYLILRRLMVTNAEPDGTIRLAGSLCKPVIDEAALVGDGDDRYYNPLDPGSTFLSNRWWSNGPTDNIKNWGGRSSLLERVQDTKFVTIRVAPYDRNVVTTFLQIRNDNRIDRYDMAIWWLRSIDVENLINKETLLAGDLFEEFRTRLNLTDQECDDLFTLSNDDAAMRVVEVSENVASPRDYLPYPEEVTTVVAEVVAEPRNLIFFGAPGTGKSYELNKLAVGADDEAGYFTKENVTRVTFHPDYTYAQFVGCYKPTEIDKYEDSDEGRKLVGTEISYSFIPGPFLEIYIKACKNPDTNYLLIIEEINRANPAAAFGDIFQILDRKEDGTSEYAITTPYDMRRYLKVFLPAGADKTDINPQTLESTYDRLRREADCLCLPPNLYIWATMNSADQGVFPMDTAFKRRWDFRYMGINDGSKKLAGITVPVGTPTRMVSWDALRRGVNKVLQDAGVNEDKLLGPFFISPSRLRDTEHFTQTFMDKVLLYLFEDAAKTKKAKVFSHDGNPTYSEVCDDFKTKGELAFKGMKELASVGGGQDEAAEGPAEPDGEE